MYFTKRARKLKMNCYIHHVKRLQFMGGTYHFGIIYIYIYTCFSPPQLFTLNVRAYFWKITSSSRRFAKKYATYIMPPKFHKPMIVNLIKDI